MNEVNDCVQLLLFPVSGCFNILDYKFNIPFPFLKFHNIFWSLF